MSYYYRQVQFGPGYLTPIIKNIIIINVAIFLLQSILNRFLGNGYFLVTTFGVSTAFIKQLYIWQPATYMFLHGDMWHVLFNMLYLWMFGTDVERKMGSRQFTVFYLFCGVSAGLLTCVFNLFTGMTAPTIGASGAIFGVLLAFGLYFPDRMVLVFLIIPVKALYFVLGLGAMELYYLVFMMQGASISYIAHVGGMISAYVYFRNQDKIWNSIEASAERGEKFRKTISAAKKEEDQKRVDEILDKINTEGMHKLTREERKFLRERSKKRKE